MSKRDEQQFCWRISSMSNRATLSTSKGPTHGGFFGHLWPNRRFIINIGRDRQKRGMENEIENRGSPRNGKSFFDSEIRPGFQGRFYGRGFFRWTFLLIFQVLIKVLSKLLNQLPQDLFLFCACSHCACTRRLYPGACSLRLSPLFACSFSALVPKLRLFPKLIRC